jgi:hypothetical protein
MHHRVIHHGIRTAFRLMGGGEIGIGPARQERTNQQARLWKNNPCCGAPWGV